MIEKETNTYDDGNVAFIRRIDQFNADSEKRIAVDDGIPFLQLNLEDLKEITSETFCPGTYSHFCRTLDGQKNSSCYPGN